MCRTKKGWLPICLVVVLFLGISFQAFSSSVIPPKNFGELVRISDLVIVAKAGGGTGFKRGELIMSGTTFTIIDVIKGSALPGSDIQVETFGGENGDMGLSIGGSPQFTEGDVYLLSLNEFNGEWTFRFMSYGILVQRRMVTGKQVFTHLEIAHELNIVVPDGREIEPITTYSSSTVVSYLKQVASGASDWSRGDAGEVANAGHDGSLQMDGIMGLDAAPPGCAYIINDGTPVRWRRFEQQLNVGVKVINGAPANVVTAVQNSIAAWKAVAGIDMGTLSYAGNNPAPAGCPSFGITNWNSMPIGESHIYLDDPCNEITDLDNNCVGILAIAGPGYHLTPHVRNGENWLEAVFGVMVVNNGTPTCYTAAQYEQVITHELGHIFGFGHHTGGTANMNAMCCSPITWLDETCAFYPYGTGEGNALPVITSINPNNADHGTNNLEVQINGANFVPYGVVTTSGSGITYNSIALVNSTQLTLNINIAPDATPGDRTVTFSNPPPGGGKSNAVTFTVNNPAPLLTSLSPSWADRGTSNFNVTINGNNLNVDGAEVVFSGTGIVINSTQRLNNTTATMNISIAPDATLGDRSFTWATPAPGGGQSSLTFTVTEPANPVPTLTLVAPNTGAQGTAVPVTLTGTNFVAGSTVQVSGTGIAVSNVSVTNATTITALLTIMGGADLGARNVTVTNPAPGGGTSAPQTFTVTMAPNAVPVLTTITPNSGVVGSSVNVSLIGTGFMAGSTVAVSGTGVTVSNVTIASTTLITAQFTISGGAAIGARNVSVTNPAPGGGTSALQTFTVTEMFVNKQPTMNVISDVSFLHTAAEQVVNLSGISAGAGENQNLTVTAVAANPQLIQTLSVQYVSPQATGTLRFQNDRSMVGTTTITVKVKDNGGTANSGVDSLMRVFTVNVNLDTDLETDETDLPTEYALLQNYPNPFNPSTVIPFHLPGRAFVTIGVYDVTGRLRTTLLHQEMGAGRHELPLDASSFGSGLYLVRMTSEFGIKSTMIMLVK